MEVAISFLEVMILTRLTLLHDFVKSNNEFGLYKCAPAWAHWAARVSQLRLTLQRLCLRVSHW